MAGVSLVYHSKGSLVESPTVSRIFIIRYSYTRYRPLSILLIFTPRKFLISLSFINVKVLNDGFFFKESLFILYCREYNKVSIWLVCLHLDLEIVIITLSTEIIISRLPRVNR